MAELMGAFPAAVGVVTWRGGGVTLMLTLFCRQQYQSQQLPPCRRGIDRASMLAFSTQVLMQAIVKI